MAAETPPPKKKQMAEFFFIFECLLTQNQTNQGC